MHNSAAFFAAFFASSVRNSADQAGTRIRVHKCRFRSGVVGIRFSGLDFKEHHVFLFYPVPPDEVHVAAKGFTPIPEFQILQASLGETPNILMIPSSMSGRRLVRGMPRSNPSVC